MKWYKRSGQRVKPSTVLKAKSDYAYAKETGKMGNISCKINLQIAKRIESMSLIEFSNYSGMFTYRK